MRIFASRKISFKKGQKKMKKFLAIVFALIFALSACTVAFASEADLTCESCKAKLVDAKAYAAHVNGGCLIDFKDCPYCSARVATANLDAHKADCPKGAGKCEYCDAAYDTQADYEAHKKECKMITTVGSEDAAKIVDKIIEALKSVDWAELANKVVDAVKSIDLEGIIAKVKPIIEKVVGFVGEIELPAAK